MTGLFTFQSIFRRLTEQEQIEVASRIGWLCFFNPMEPEGFIKLDLGVREQRIVAEVLVDLSVVEPGENWIGETLNDRQFELTTGWVKRQGGTLMPYKGILSLTYVSKPAWVRPDARYENCELFAVYDILKNSPVLRSQYHITA